MKFLPYEMSDFEAVKSILEKAFDQPQQSKNFSTLGKAESTDSYYRFVAKDGDAVIGYLGYALRNMRYLEQEYTAASIGPVAVSPDVQQSGIGSFLMTETLEYLEKTGVEVVYIQGIPDYYQRFGFIKYLDKSKRIISTEGNQLAEADSLRIVENTTNRRAYRDLFDQYRSNVNFSSARNEHDWRWLLGPATQTYYFYRPKLIQSIDGQNLAYFCDDPDVDNSPRELVFEEEDSPVERTLEALKAHYRERGCQTFELKAPESARIVAFVDAIGCQKITYVNPRGGDLMLIHDELRVAKKLSSCVCTLLQNISCEFSAQLNFEAFSITFGVKQGQSHFDVKSSKKPSRLRLVHFMSGRINGDLLEHTSVTGFSSYEVLQTVLFSNKDGFVFQGDNM